MITASAGWRAIARLNNALICALLLSVAACSSTSPEHPHRLRLGVAYDVSESATKQGVPVLNKMEIEQMLSILKARGGVMALGLIDERAFEPLARCEFTELDGRLDERARKNQRNRKAESDFTT